MTSTRTFVRDNWIAVVFILAVIASFVVNQRQSVNADNRQTANVVEGCVSNSVRTAIGAQGWMRLSERVAERNNRGDQVSAGRYAAVAGGMIAQIAAPPGYEGSHILAEVQERRDASGHIKIVVTNRAAKLHREGCKLRYEQ